MVKVIFLFRFRSDMKKEDVHVIVENNLLTLRGERNFDDKIERENFHRIERHYGEFLRTFTLPTFVDGNKRTGMLSAVVFLQLNDVAVEFSEASIVAMVLGLAASEIGEDEFAQWLREAAR